VKDFYIFGLSGFFVGFSCYSLLIVCVGFFFVSLCVGVGISFFLYRRVLWRHLVR